MTAIASRTGGRILVDQLKIHGVQHAFCVPGESYLAVLDALHDSREPSSSTSAVRKVAPRTWPRPTES